MACPKCAQAVEYRHALIMKCNNSHLPGYDELIKKARDALRHITRGDGRYVRFFYPEYPLLRSMSSLRRTVRKRALRADWDELREEELQAPGEGAIDDSADYVPGLDSDENEAASEE